MLHKRYVRLNEPGLRLVVTLSGARIEIRKYSRTACTASIGRLIAFDFFMLLKLHRFEVMIDYRDSVQQNLGGGLAIQDNRTVSTAVRPLVFDRLQLLLLETQLSQKAFPQIAATDSWRIHLPDRLQRLLQTAHD